MIPKARVYKGGKIVTPTFLRKMLNLREGEEVIFEIQGNSLVMTSLISSYLIIIIFLK